MRLVAAIGCALLLSTVLAAQAQTPTGDGTGFEKKNYNYSEWTKGLFSEVVTVTHPGKMIFLALQRPRMYAAAAATAPAKITRNTFLPLHPGAIRYYRQIGALDYRIECAATPARPAR
ncbi:MAG: hypothetical protein WBF44_05065 [Pseudolabrys sp.]